MTRWKPLTDRRIRSAGDLSGLSFWENGLLPVVTQDFESGAVLMVAFANREALEKTLETGEMHYWSRSRQELWHKGATSGNLQALVSLHADCDTDTLLARVRSPGPACHTGETTCFGDLSFDGELPASPPEVLPEYTIPGLWSVLRARKETLPEGSYTARLLTDENLRLKKLGEETAELLLALARGERARVAEEGADLVYHLLTAMMGAGVELDDLLDELEKRRG
jgi:phosphoribosyl-ATP pyrophosphohydrolase/phosphoribosyl-AMP cyclohydrolase